MITCDFCEKEFETHEGLNSHNGQVHRDKLYTDFECPICHDFIKVLKSELKNNKRKTCRNDKCSKKYRSKIMTGENNHQWKGGKVKIDCNYCDNSRMVERFYKNTYLTCGSKECKVKRAKEHLDEIRATDKKEVREKIRQSKIGANNPNWSGGVKLPRGRNWETQRKKAIKRDNNKCRQCGLHRKSHYDKYNCDLHVDHITPRREFIFNGKLDWKKANKLDNLMTLCCVCHSKKSWSNNFKQKDELKWDYVEPMSY